MVGFLKVPLYQPKGVKCHFEKPEISALLVLSFRVQMEGISNCDTLLSAQSNASVALNLLQRCGCGSTPLVPFWGRCTTHLVYFSGDWDVHWGYDLDFDP